MTNYFSVVGITVPLQCGKTTLAKQLAKEFKSKFGNSQVKRRISFIKKAMKQFNNVTM